MHGHGGRARGEPAAENREGSEATGVDRDGAQVGIPVCGRRRVLGAFGLRRDRGHPSLSARIGLWLQQFGLDGKQR